MTANGGLISTSGSLNVAIAASYHSIPLVICAGLYTMTPTYPYSTEELNLFSCPAPFEFKRDDLDLISPEFDYIPPTLLALFITNVGPHPPSYIRKLLVESYGRE